MTWQILHHYCAAPVKILRCSLVAVVKSDVACRHFLFIYFYLRNTVNPPWGLLEEWKKIQTLYKQGNEMAIQEEYTRVLVSSRASVATLTGWVATCRDLTALTGLLTVLGDDTASTSPVLCSTCKDNALYVSPHLHRNTKHFQFHWLRYRITSSSKDLLCLFIESRWISQGIQILF